MRAIGLALIAAVLFTVSIPKEAGAQVIVLDAFKLTKPSTGVVRAEGTFMVSTAREDSGTPIQTSKIECHKEAGVCYEATAMLVDFPGTPLSQMRVYLDHWKITSWEAGKIVARAVEQPECQALTMEFDLSKREVNYLRVPRAPLAPACEGSAQKRIALKLSDGVAAAKSVLPPEVAPFLDQMAAAFNRAQ